MSEYLKNALDEVDARTTTMWCIGATILGIAAWTILRAAIAIR